jgi:hypothetical protein
MNARPPRTTSRLLIHEPALQVLPSLAVAIGLNEAIFLQQLHYWLVSSKHEHEESGGVAKPSQTTPPPQGQRESDEALKQYGYDAGQRRKIYAARLPLTDQEIADLPEYIAALKRAGKRNPIGIVYNELIDGKSIPHPEDVAPTEAPLEYIYTDDGRAIPKDPERHARIQAQRKAQLAAAGYR